jgi:hypothetical protein
VTNEINNELEFLSHIQSIPDRQLLEFVARQNYETCIRCEQHNERLISLENGNRNVSGITGGITGTISAIIISIISYFSNRS